MDPTTEFSKNIVDSHLWQCKRTILLSRLLSDIATMTSLTKPSLGPMADSNRPPMSQYDQSVAGSSMFANAYNSGLAAGMQCHVTNSDPHKLQWMHPPDTFQYDMDPVLSHLASEVL